MHARRLLVDCNKLAVDIDNEIAVVHNFIRDKYRLQFPELESLVSTHACGGHSSTVHNQYMVHHQYVTQHYSISVQYNIISTWHIIRTPSVHLPPSTHTRTHRARAHTHTHTHTRTHTHTVCPYG